MFALSFATAKETLSDGVVYLTFDESPERLQSYIDKWQGNIKITFLDVRPDPDTLISGKHIELTSLLVRIEHAIKSTGARNLVIDAIDTLFETFEDKATVHQGISRIFNWSRDNGISLITTAGESSDYRVGTGLLDYSSDCTLLLSQDMDDGLMTRSVRVLKNRGSGHGTNKYPYIIDADGIALAPITSTQMTADASKVHLSMGNAKLDQMLGGKGIWTGSSVMITGQSGTGKSLLAAKCAETACQAELKVLYISFEESPRQFIRDVGSVGIRLSKHVKSGALTMRSERAVERPLEEHMILYSRQLEALSPDLVIFDPITAIGDIGNSQAFKSVIIRLGQFLKDRQITFIMTELLPDYSGNVSSINISSLVDTWIRLRRVERDDTMTRQIHIHKSRGMKTSNHVEDFEITNKGFVIGSQTAKEQT